MTDPLLPTRLALAFTAEGRAKAARLIKERHPVLLKRGKW